ncbi:Octopamine receptor beta-2R [Holothuria leucospilota]|uniref:Octopamine receptor beta-2R n=1 Tax=Holothuria leucospilota TaxID=206669 RepID=A0A9Q1CFC0_HOLLE|nr:Octopamine receptor beta-2R [Holothuria leucospilota]
MDANISYVSHIELPLRQQVANLVLGIAIVIVNFLVMVAFAQDRDIRRIPANYFVLNLSITDFLTGLNCIVTFFWSVHGGVVPSFENTPCVIIGALHHGVALMSVLIVLQISHDRLKMVSNPFKHREKTVRHAILIALSGWLFVALYVLVIFITHWLIIHEPTRAICVVTNLPRAFVSVSLCIGFALPLFALISLNVLLIGRLRRATLEKFRKKRSETNRIIMNEKNAFTEVERSDQHNRNSTDGDEITSHVEATKICKYSTPKKAQDKYEGALSHADGAIERELHKVSKAARKLMIFVGVFCLNWLPFYVIILIDTIVPVPDWLVTGGSLNVSFNSFINPFLYALMNRRFRHRFLLMNMNFKRKFTKLWRI